MTIGTLYEKRYSFLQDKCAIALYLYSVYMYGSGRAELP